jgi:hypothetical protein
MKVCSKCNEALDVVAFHKNKASTDGLRPSCIKCNSSIRKAWRDNNRERIRAVNTVYRKQNPDKYSGYAVKCFKKRRNCNVEVKLTHNYRNVIRQALKRNSKTGLAVDLLGCSISDYKQYLESMFIGKMSWENKGYLWEIDHITPISKFKIDDLLEAKKAFNHKNTQPIMKSDHLTKTKIELKQIFNSN